MIYISLTTVPLRMSEWNSAKQNLESLLNQNTIHDYKVILNIPYYYKVKNNEEYIISDNLLKLAQDNPKLIINRVEVDHGPLTKILGALPLTNPEDLLIVVDDDHYYHEDMLDYHVTKRLQYPKSIIAFRGDIPIEKREWIEDEVKKYTLRSTHLFFPVKNDLQLVIPGHWHSVGYIRSFFEDDFTSDEILNSSNNDDIVAGYYFKKKQKDIICAKWDNETDWRPVNECGRPSYSFPIKYTLPMPDSGFNEFRRQSGDGYGKSEEYTKALVYNHNIIYTENE
jgi:hypothetical protein